jgi:hypothetical protein
LDILSNETGAPSPQQQLQLSSQDRSANPQRPTLMLHCTRTFPDAELEKVVFFEIKKFRITLISTPN